MLPVKSNTPAEFCRPHLFLRGLSGGLEKLGFKEIELSAGKLVCKLNRE